MSFGLVHALMLAGLAGMLIPPILHRLSRREEEEIAWGAMQFLDDDPPTPQRVRFENPWLMAVRMAVLGLAALALARPYVSPRPYGDDASGLRPGPAGPSDGSRDVVLILDASSSMAHRGPDGSAFEVARAWARSFLGRLAPQDAVALLVARDRVARAIGPPTTDHARVASALDALPPPRGSSDLPAAIGEAFRILETPGRRAREVIILSDGQRFAWRPDELSRWRLLRDIRQQIPGDPRLWAPELAPPPAPDDPPDASVGPIGVSRNVLAPGMSVVVTAEVGNAGPAPVTREAELLLDGQLVADSARAVGPIPPGAAATLRFRATLADPGSHLLAIKLRPSGDPNPANDLAERPILVRDPLRVLLVDGDPGDASSSLDGELGFLGAALAPAADEAPLARTRLVAADAFDPAMLDDRDLLILADPAQVGAGLADAMAGFVNRGGGLLIILGDRTDPAELADRLGPRGANVLPALPLAIRGDFAARQPVAHPAPGSFRGAVMAPLSVGNPPALASAGLFAYHAVQVDDTAEVVARLDDGSPWIVERPHGRGRVAMLTAPVNAAGGTLPVNPDFVPLIHEWAAHLGGPVVDGRPASPGEPLTFPLEPPPPPGLASLPLTDPDGAAATLSIRRNDRGEPLAQLPAPSETGVYRLGPADGWKHASYALVTPERRESDPARLTEDDRTQLSGRWPLDFDTPPGQLAGRVLRPVDDGPREFWRPLIALALAGLCLEAWITRRLARGPGGRRAIP